MWGGAAIALVGAVLLGCFDLESVDLGYHLAYGRWMLEHGAVQTTKVFNVAHPGHAFVNDKWLFQVALAALAPLGWWALVALRIALVVAIGAMLAGWIGERVSLSSPLPWLLVLLALWTMGPRLMLRPELAGYALVVAVAWSAERLRRVSAETPWWLWLAPLVALQVLWVNVHGSFPFGFLLLGALGVCGHRRALLASAAMAAACVVNPHGWQVYWYPVQMVRDVSSDPLIGRTITEFAPTFAPLPFEPSWRRCYVALLALAVVATLVGLVRRRGAHLHPLILLVAFAGLSLSMRRHVALFAPVGAWLVAAGLAEVRWGPRWRALGWALLLVVAPLALLQLPTDRLYQAEHRVRRFGWGRSPLVGAPGALIFARRELLSRWPEYGNGANLGGYLMGELGQAAPPLIDNHTNSLPLAFRRRVLEVVVGRASPTPLSRELGLRWWVVGTGAHAEPALLSRLLAETTWEPAYAGDDAVVFVDVAVPELAALAARLREELARGEAEAPPVGLPTPAPRPLLGSWRALSLSRGPQDVRAARRARVYADLGYSRLAAGALREALVADWDARLMARAGALLAGDGQRDAARAYFDASLALAPRYPTAHGNLGRLLLSAGEVEDGRRHLRRAFELAPDRPAHAIALASVAATGEEAAAIARRSLSWRPDSARVWRVALSRWRAAGEAARAASVAAVVDELGEVPDGR